MPHHRGPLSEAITADFEETTNTSTVSAATVILVNNTIPVAGTLTYDGLPDA